MNGTTGTFYDQAYVSSLNAVNNLVETSFFLLVNVTKNKKRKVFDYPCHSECVAESGK